MTKTSRDFKKRAKAASNAEYLGSPGRGGESQVAVGINVVSCYTSATELRTFFISEIVPFDERPNNLVDVLHFQLLLCPCLPLIYRFQ